jgi:diaminopimelate epimerase
MDLFLGDASPMEGCGDGLRCLAKFVFEQGLAPKTQLRVETYLRVWYLDLLIQEDQVAQVRIDMGPPVLEAARIPTSLPGNPPLDIPMTWPDTDFYVSCIGMGDPHAVVFVPEITTDLVEGVGAQMSRHSVFPRGTNVVFVKRRRRDEVAVRVWGRGGGEKASSSSAAGAVVVAGALTGRTERHLKVYMPGGELEVNWSSDLWDHVHVTGSVEGIHQGDWPE